MADNKSIATRDSYGAALLELADAGHDDIVVFDADLSASTRTSVFAKKYSERFFDCGIAEQNMLAFAGGTALLAAVLFVPGLSQLFAVTPLGAAQIGQIAALAFAPTVLIQLFKALARR